MADEAALLQAVLDAPDDDAPRLAYAKWSEDQGDAASVARAELIRTQIDLARLDPADLQAGRVFVTQQRTVELVARHGSAWAGALAGWVEAFHFVRGFAGWIGLTARSFLDHGD